MKSHLQIHQGRRAGRQPCRDTQPRSRHCLHLCLHPSRLHRRALRRPRPRLRRIRHHHLPPLRHPARSHRLSYHRRSRRRRSTLRASRRSHGSQSWCRQAASSRRVASRNATCARRGVAGASHPRQAATGGKRRARTSHRSEMPPRLSQDGSQTGCSSARQLLRFSCLCCARASRWRRAMRPPLLTRRS